MTTFDLQESLGKSFKKGRWISSLRSQTELEDCTADTTSSNTAAVPLFLRFGMAPWLGALMWECVHFNTGRARKAPTADRRSVLGGAEEPRTTTGNVSDFFYNH